ncbi:MAG: Wzz/FepE/Etk N-terminal domain-containing protein [Candidatus Edwardsbacteria bacterium]|nr:Wzz/FepE/Etk N-terminal domain-containing protein [Candidatus Edwardsbacteria bacterium]
MENPNDRELKDLWQQVFRGWMIIGSAMILAALAGLLVSLASPKIYQAEVLAAVPESGKLTAISSESKGTLFVLVNVGGTSPLKSKPTTVSLVNIPETKAMINQLWGRIKSGPPGLTFPLGEAAIIEGIRCEEIRGSENIFRLIVQTSQPGQPAEKALLGAVAYLNDNQFIKLKIEEERKSLDQSIRDTEENLQKALLIRDGLQRSGSFRQNPNFNPAELETSINDLKVKINNLRNSLANITGYRIIEKPVAGTDPIRPKVLSNILMSLALGLMLGLLAVFIKGAVRDRSC